MRAGFELLALVLAVAGVAAEEPHSKCDTKDFACHDVMNSSQCLAQLIYDKNAKTTREALIKCVDTEGSASSLPGATRVSREHPKALLTETGTDATA